MRKKAAAAFVAAILTLMGLSGLFENELIEGYSRLLGFIGQSGNEQIILGREGWLFFSETLPDYLGETTDIAQAAETIKAYSDELKAHGIGFTFLCAPNKNSIYPEFMPYYTKQGDNSLPKLNQTLTDMGVDVVDAYTLLLNSKARGLLYHKTDSHWNALGAALVYRELMAHLGAPCEDDQTTVWSETPFRGDLVHLYRPLSDDLVMDYAPEIPRKYKTKLPMRSVSDMRIESESPANNLNLLVLRDSFGDALFPYLANNAGRMVYSRQAALDAEAAIAENVSHVVFIIAQRSLTAAFE
jgi:hypothetical protein